MRKTIFITITRGGLVRNILRTEILKILIDHNIQVVIIVPYKIKEYFRKEFSHPNIEIEYCPAKNYSKFRKFFLILFKGLVYTETEKRKLKFGSGYKQPPSKIEYFLKHLIFLVVSKIKFFRYLARWIEQNIFLDKDYDYLFEKYKPDLLFCSSIYSNIDIIFTKAAKRFGVISIGMPKTWDTIGRLFFPVAQDKVIVQNNFMKEWIVAEQLVKKGDIYVAGIPQFDIYRQKVKYLNKNEFCQKTNLDPERPIILFASEGEWTHWDEIYIDDLIKAGILDKYNLILRPHFSNLQEKRYYRFKQYKYLYIDDEHTRITNMFNDKWDPTAENMNWLAEVLNISDVVITFMSTFVLDAFAYNKPVINIYYDLPVPPEVKRNYFITPMNKLYNCFHYNAVLEERSVALAHSAVEVMKWIEKYLQNFKIHQTERQNTIRKLCYKLDGNSAKRVANYILSNL